MSAPLTHAAAEHFSEGDAVSSEQLAGAPFLRLLRLLEEMNAASRCVNYDDPAAERAYYAQAGTVVEAIIQTPATTMADLRIKAEAYVWCCGEMPDFEAKSGDTTDARVVASILRDLLRR